MSVSYCYYPKYYVLNRKRTWSPWEANSCSGSQEILGI